MCVYVCVYIYIYKCPGISNSVQNQEIYVVDKSLFILDKYYLVNVMFIIIIIISGSQISSKLK